MSLARKLARLEERKAQKNPLEALKSLPNAKEMAKVKEAVEGIQQLRDALDETRNVCNQTFPYVIGDIQSLIYHTERQRAVTLKLMTMERQTKSISELLENEAQFKFEYDVMYAFIVLSENYIQGVT